MIRWTSWRDSKLSWNFLHLILTSFCLEEAKPWNNPLTILINLILVYTTMLLVTTNNKRILDSSRIVGKTKLRIFQTYLLLISIKWFSKVFSNIKTIKTTNQVCIFIKAKIWTLQDLLFRSTRIDQGKHRRKSRLMWQIRSKRVFHLWTVSMQRTTN